jgi:hypothetical protein
MDVPYSTRKRTWFALSFAILLSIGIAWANNGAIAAVIGYMNLLDPRLVVEIENEVGDVENADLLVAEALVERLRVTTVVNEDLSNAMASALQTGEGTTVRSELFIVWLLDVVTGVDPFDEVLQNLGILGSGETFDYDAVMQRMLFFGEEVALFIERELPGITVPRSASGDLADVLVTETVAGILTDVAALTTIQDRYEVAISPIADTTLTRPR